MWRRWLLRLICFYCFFSFFSLCRYVWISPSLILLCLSSLLERTLFLTFKKSHFSASDRIKLIIFFLHPDICSDFFFCFIFLFLFFFCSNAPKSPPKQNCERVSEWVLWKHANPTNKRVPEDRFFYNFFFKQIEEQTNESQPKAKTKKNKKLRGSFGRGDWRKRERANVCDPSRSSNLKIIHRVSSVFLRGETK